MLPQFEFGLGSLERLWGLAVGPRRVHGAVGWPIWECLVGMVSRVWGHNVGGCADVAPRKFRGLGVASRLRGLGHVGF